MIGAASRRGEGLEETGDEISAQIKSTNGMQLLPRLILTLTCLQHEQSRLVGEVVES